MSSINTTVAPRTLTLWGTDPNETDRLQFLVAERLCALNTLANFSGPATIAEILDDTRLAARAVRASALANLLLSGHDPVFSGGRRLSEFTALLEQGRGYPRLQPGWATEDNRILFALAFIGQHLAHQQGKYSERELTRAIAFAMTA